MNLQDELHQKINEYACKHGEDNQPNFAFCNRKIYEKLKKELKPLNNIFAFKGCFIIAGDSKEFEYFLRGEKFRVGNAF